MSDDKDKNVNQPKLDERLTPSENVRDWNPQSEEYKPSNETLAAAMNKAKEQVDKDPSITQNLSQVQSKDNDLER